MAMALDRLLAMRVAESESVDFKSTRYGNDDKSTAELLKDVTAFANWRGGTLYLGIKEDSEGRASAAPGVGEIDIDAEIMRYESVLRDSVEPDISGAIRIESVATESGAKCIVIDIEESPLGPHRITRKGKYQSEMFVRRGRSSVSADVYLMRELFSGQSRTWTMIKSFAEERKSAIRSRVLPHGDFTAPAMSILVGPRRNFGSRRLVDYSLSEEGHFVFAPGGDSDYRIRPNLLGAISRSDSVCEPYNQLFYNGYVEIFRQGFGREHAGEFTEIDGDQVGLYVGFELVRMLRRLEKVFAEGEYLVFTTFYGIHHEGIRLHGRFGGAKGQKPHLESFSIPDMTVRVDAQAEAIDEDLQILLDHIWRAWGYDRYLGDLSKVRAKRT